MKSNKMRPPMLAAEDDPSQRRLLDLDHLLEQHYRLLDLPVRLLRYSECVLQGEPARVV